MKQDIEALHTSYDQLGILPMNDLFQLSTNTLPNRYYDKQSTPREDQIGAGLSKYRTKD